MTKAVKKAYICALILSKFINPFSMATTADIKKGLCLEYNNDIYYIVDFQHVKPGKGNAFVRTKLKSLTTGKVVDNTFQSGHTINDVRVERRKFQYLYSDDMGYNFMNNETFEQVSVQETMIENANLMKEGLHHAIQPLVGLAFGSSLISMMFAIGLEFSLPKLRAMRRHVFGLGLLQVLLSMLAFTACLLLLARLGGVWDMGWQTALALGGTLDNAVVFDGDRVVSPGGLRHADEPVRHKMLDALGDLALAGGPLLGRYTGIRAGHALTNKLLRALFA